jgi:hypothetical protein
MGLYMTLSLYDVKVTDTDSPTGFKLELEGMEDVVVEAVALSGNRKNLVLKLAILVTSFGQLRQSRYTEHMQNGTVRHAAILLDEVQSTDRMYSKVNTKGVIWVTTPKTWKIPRELYIYPYEAIAQTEPAEEVEVEEVGEEEDEGTPYPPRY